MHKSDAVTVDNSTMSEEKNNEDSDIAEEMATQADSSLERTPLHVAASTCTCLEEIIEIISKADASLCYRTDEKGRTALHIAASVGNWVFVSCILKNYKPIVAIVDEYGRTALHLAVQNSHLLVVFELLPAMEGLINARDNQGKTAFDIAVLPEKPERGPSGDYVLTGVHVQKPQEWPNRTIKQLLKGSNAKGTKQLEEEEEEEEKEKVDPNSINTLSVCAVLIATVTFQVFFTLPGGTQEHGKSKASAVLIHNGLFQAFVMLNTLAFCISIVITVLLVYAKDIGQRRAIDLAGSLLPIALEAMMFELEMTINMVIAPQCLWLARCLDLVLAIFWYIITYIIFHFFLRRLSNRPLNRLERFLSWILTLYLYPLGRVSSRILGN